MKTIPCGGKNKDFQKIFSFDEVKKFEGIYKIANSSYSHIRFISLATSENQKMPLLFYMKDNELVFSNDWGQFSFIKTDEKLHLSIE